MKKATPVKRKRQESNLLAQVRLAVGARTDFMVLRINTGVFKVEGAGGREGRVRSAPDGTPDLLGIHLRRVRAMDVKEGGFMRYEKPYWEYVGQAVAIETKALKGVLSDAQNNFRAAWEAMGGVYIAAKSLDDVYDVLGRTAPEWSRTRPCPTEVV